MYGSSWTPAAAPSPPATSGACGGPLAPALYNALCVAFGDVRIRKAGELARITRVKGLTGEASNLDDPGELYAFCCPFCHERRFRGWVSHMWGQPDPVSHRPMRSLIGCLNEECFKKNPQHRHDFEMMLLCAMPAGVVGPVDKARGVKGYSGEARMPGMMARLTDSAAAMRYVEARGFDPVYLEKHYGVGFCLDAQAPFEHALDRIVIPITREYKLVGWQARRIDGRDKVMKYYTMPGFHTRSTIYNWDRLVQSDTIVLVEGILDAWAVGDQGGALFGHSLKGGQVQLLHSLRDRQPTVVLLFDRGEKGGEEGLARAREQLAPAFPDRVVVAELPPVETLTQEACRVWPLKGKKADPGALQQSTLDLIIKNAIRQQVAGQ